jgi:hemerythrin
MNVPTWSERMSVGLASMDATHREFLELLAALAAAEAEAGQFMERLDALLEHTRAHFAAEEVLMAETRFPAIGEHQAEHARVLNELGRLRAGADAGRLPLLRAYLQQLPDWFMLHLLTMDSATAAHIRRVTAAAPGLA